MIAFINISIEDADYFDLLDIVEYKYLRHIIKNNILIDVEVSIDDTETQNEEGVAVMRAIFTFDLNSDKEWVIQNDFTWTSCFGIKLNNILCDDNDDTNTDTTEDTDDIYSEPSSPRSVIN
jgi:hypothetical protein